MDLGDVDRLVVVFQDYTEAVFPRAAPPIVVEDEPDIDHGGAFVLNRYSSVAEADLNGHNQCQ